MKYANGGAGRYAEIIIDYDKKKVDILNPTTRKAFEEKLYKPRPSYFILGLIIFLIIQKFYNSSFIINHNLSVYTFCVLICWGLLLIPKVRTNYDYLIQKLQENQIEKKIVVLEGDLGKKEYKLPFIFKNEVLDFNCEGDYNLLEKVHIKPLDYYKNRNGNLVKQDEEWEAFFSFKEIPKQGKMIIGFD